MYGVVQSINTDASALFLAMIKPSRTGYSKYSPEGLKHGGNQDEIWQTKSRDYLLFLGELQAGVPYMLASSVDKGYVFWFGEALSTK